MESNVAAEQRLKLESQHVSGANWFFWIAGLSMVNSILLHTGSEWSFIVGLGITQLFDAIVSAVAGEAGGAAIAVAVVFDVSIAGLFVALGAFARRRFHALFVLGMVLYALDGLLFLVVSDWLSLGFHAFALFGMYGGLRASMALRQTEESVVPAAA